MSSLKDLQSPIRSELKEFEEYFESSMDSKVALLNRISHYIVKRKGKQVRPMLVMLSAKCYGEINEATYVASSLIELLHTATLVHDDVVDDAHMRRGFFSVNAIWKNKIAVLVGDFFFAKGFLLAIEHEQYRLLQIISEAVKLMSEGELLQMEKSRKLDITEDVYYDIIKQKTASMLAASCAAGCASTSSDDEVVQNMKEFGTYAGMSYQIKDDLFDYGYANVGKPTGNDIKEKKLTLPLIYALDKAPDSDSKRILKMIKSASQKRKTRQAIFTFVNEHNGLDYAAERMHHYRDLALEKLQHVPESESREALSSLVEYMTSRRA